MTLELKKFDMSMITFKKEENKGPVVVLIGRRDTGKSFLVRDLLFNHRNIPLGTVISGTEAGNGFYSEHVPKLFIHDEYSTEIIANILKRQKQVLKQMKKQIEVYKFIIGILLGIFSTDLLKVLGASFLTKYLNQRNLDLLSKVIGILLLVFASVILLKAFL